MSFNRTQRQSEGFRHGEGTIHTKARERLEFMLRHAGWEVHPNCGITVSSALINMWGHALKRTSYDKEFDTYSTKKHDNGLTSELIIEIDGKSHNSKVQQGKDKTAEEYAAFFLPDARFVRIDIAILLNHNISDKSILEMYKI